MKTLFTLIAASLFAISMPVLADQHEEGAHCKMHKKDHFTSADTNKDGTLDKAEAQAMHDKKFDAMDTNHDGKLSEDEAAACKRDHKH